MSLIRVAVYQPVVPEYRVPFFNGVSERDGLQLTVHASAAFPGAPPKGISGFKFSYVERPCHRVFGNSLFWQEGRRLPESLARGDVIVCGNARVLSDYFCILQALRRRIGVVWWSQWRSFGPRKVSAGLRRQMMKLADVILLYNDQEVQEALNWGFPSHRLFATNNALDTSRIEGLRQLWTTERLRDFQAVQGLEGQTTLLFCGRLNPHCELPVAFEALAMLRERCLPLRLVVIGDGPARRAFVSAAEKYGVSDNVRWCGALYGDDQVAPWFLSAAAFVFPGPIGLSLLHAFAYGLPVVTHGDPAFHGPEFLALRSGWSGLVFRRGDAHDLAAKLQLLLEDTPMRLEIHQNALKTVRENYSLEAMIDRFVRAVQRASALSMGQPAEVSRNARATVTATTRNPREDAERE